MSSVLKALSHRRGSVEQEVGWRSSLEPRLRGVGGGQVCGGRPQDDQIRQLLECVLEVFVAHLHPEGYHINGAASQVALTTAVGAIRACCCGPTAAADGRACCL